jgi:hypothetical protein
MGTPRRRALTGVIPMGQVTGSSSVPMRATRANARLGYEVGPRAERRWRRSPLIGRKQRLASVVVALIPPLAGNIRIQYVTDHFWNRNRALAPVLVLQRRPRTGSVTEIQIPLFGTVITEIERTDATESRPGTPQHLQERVLIRSEGRGDSR